MGVIVIAEAGVNHNGDMNIAKKLVEAASLANADIVKFQTFKAGSVVTQNAPMADYQKLNVDSSQNQLDMLSKLELSRDMHEEIIDQCRDYQIDFLSTAFDIESIDYLASLGASCFKIPSGEITNLPYLRHIGKFGKSLILSTGMSNLGEIEIALDILVRSGTSKEKITVLHCNTSYPTPMQDVNLMAMCTIRDAFDVKVGYSDHTLGVEASVAAVALGATIIEKHLTLNCQLPGPDHKASLEPHQFAAMVNAIRNIEVAIGSGIKRASASESQNMLIARKSLVASKCIQIGEVFSPDNVAVKRPGNGLSPMYWDLIMGRRASRNFAADELLEL